MRTNIPMAVIAMLLLSVSANAQRTVDDISKVYTNYEADLNVNENSGKDANQKKKLAYNPKMLNMFIANNISTYLSSSKDISLQKYYAVLESGDGSLFVGYNFMFRKDKITRLRNLFNVGLKADLENNFAAIMTDNKVNPELALNLKYTYIRKGKVKFDNGDRTIIDNYRSSYIKEKFKADLAKFSSAEPGAKADENTELEVKLKYVTNLTSTEKQELIDDEYTAQYEKIAAEEEKFITDHKVFNSIVSSWLTFETYIPFNSKSYEISPSTSTFATTRERFYNFNLTGSFTRMQKWSNKSTLYLTGSLSAFNSNNIVTKEMDDYKFETIANQGGPNQTVTDSKDAYVGTYKADFSQSAKVELVYFFVKDITGLSLAYENVFGALSTQNWKIAVPFSLKDKDDKPSVNLELQYKQIYDETFVGISVGFAFGKFLK